MLGSQLNQMSHKEALMARQPGPPPTYSYDMGYGSTNFPLDRDGGWLGLMGVIVGMPAATLTGAISWNTRDHSPPPPLDKDNHVPI